MIAASTEASMAASPSVGPTVRCSMISTGTGSAPPLIRTERSLADSWVKSPVMLRRVAAAGRAQLRHDTAGTR